MERCLPDGYCQMRWSAGQGLLRSAPRALTVIRVAVCAIPCDRHGPALDASSDRSPAVYSAGASKRNFACS